jgi:hypothetical protein
MKDLDIESPSNRASDNSGSGHLCNNYCKQLIDFHLMILFFHYTRKKQNNGYIGSMAVYSKIEHGKKLHFV